jgi:hypothetical protein
MTALLAESTGQLSVVISDQRLDELAFRTAVEIVESGDHLIVVDPAGCFDPNRMTHSARIGNLDPVGLLRHLHILRAAAAEDMEAIVAHQLEDAFEKHGTKHVLVPDLLAALYHPRISTRDAARILGRIRGKLEQLAQHGAQIVILCRQEAGELGTKAHFQSSLCASADKVYLRNNT